MELWFLFIVKKIISMARKGGKVVVIIICCIDQIFRDVMEKSFPEFYDYYLSVINDNSHLNGQNMLVRTN